MHILYSSAFEKDSGISDDPEWTIHGIKIISLTINQPYCRECYGLKQ